MSKSKKHDSAVKEQGLSYVTELETSLNELYETLQGLPAYQKSALPDIVLQRLFEHEDLANEVFDWLESVKQK